MSNLTLGRERLRDLVAGLLEAYPRVIAPVALPSAGATTPAVVFQPLVAAEEACFDFVNSTR
ncbi:MAG: hypothetical protein KAX80_09895, partial [Planctomycetes bacterium]|nr:hypothetical protein [Planctomycetota bacterium]